MKVDKGNGVRKHIYLTQKQNEKLELLAKQSGLSVSTFIRFAMIKILAKKH